MTGHWHIVPGLARKIWLPDHIRFVIRILPASQTNQRPGYTLWQNPKWIGHETGNYRPGTGAENHAVYLENGAPARDQFGRLYSQQLGYHLTGDDHEVFMLVPADEVTWQAACGACTGNYGCWSYEQAVNPETNQDVARDIHEWVAAAFLEAANRPAVPENITRHWDHNNVYGDPNHPERHRCPELMLRDNYWGTFQAEVARKWALIRAIRNAEESPTPPPPPPPVYAEPVLPDWFERLDAVEHPPDQKFRGRTAYVARRNYRNVGKRATTRYSEPFARGTEPPEASGPKVQPNEKVFGIRLWVHPDDGRTWILEETGHWLLASQFTPRVRIDPRTAD